MWAGSIYCDEDVGFANNARELKNIPNVDSFHYTIRLLTRQT